MKSYQKKREELQDELHRDHLATHKAYLQFHKEREAVQNKLHKEHLDKHKAYAGD